MLVGMADLVEMIREKQARFQELAEEMAVLRKELEAARALLSEGQTPRRVVRHAGRRPKGQEPIKPDSSAGLALKILRERGRPMHANAILQRIREQNHEVNKGTLIGQLTRYVNQRIVFNRPEPNTFGLLEWVMPNIVIARQEGVKPENGKGALTEPEALSARP